MGTRIQRGFLKVFSSIVCRACLVLLSLIQFPVTAPAKTLDTCFSPLGYCDQVLVSWINAAEHTVYGAIYGLTDETIAQAMIKAKERSVRVRLVHDRTQAAGKRDVTEELMSAGVKVHVQRGSGGGILHDKLLIIDKKYVITGSFNWTNNATKKNDENFVVLDDDAPRFKTEFERLWGKSLYVTSSL
jgi:phosphatidylserine/phosphatidylglycerophosphate/cardiolipin synthase-like enzyme